EGLARGPPLLGVLERLLAVLRREAELHAAAMVVLRMAGGIRLEVGPLREHQVELDDAAARLPAFDVRHEFRRQVLALEMAEESGLGMDRRDQRASAQLLSAREHDTHRPALLDEYALDRRPR